MKQNVKVAVLGTGQMGSGVVSLLLEKEGIEFVGAFGRRAERAGTDVGQAVGLGKDLGLKLARDLPDLLKKTRPDVVIQCTCSKVVDAFDEIKTALEKGANVISIAEEMSFPFYEAPELAEQIHELALENKATVLGTGINPGFVLDLLVIALTGVCQRVDSITARRANDLSPYGASVLRTQGVGITPEEFEKGVREGKVVGHFGFNESIGMIAKALDWKIDKIEQAREPIVSKVQRKTQFVTIEPGFTEVCRHTATAYMNGKPVIELIHPQQVQPHLEGVETEDCIEIRGVPNVSLSGSPEIPGGVATVALAVNMIPPVINADPGLVTMADLPVPAVIMGDVRNLLKDKADV